jgi:hypothetical protein
MKESVPKEVRMTARGIERAAYIAAHRILAANTTAAELVCPGAKRSHAVDSIADIIREVFELHNQNPEEMTTVRQREVELGPRLVNHRRTGTVLELPMRVSS